ncbi:MAG TPA: tetratricopeptide repeat protein [Usitatibacter sp.]|nr:tetratricopeptide repeat protein [Usitatibacter sp.]
MSGSYDFEEQERIAELRAWWEDNRWFVIAAATAAVLAFIGYRGYAWWHHKALEDAANAYQPVADAMTAGDKKKADDAARAFIEKHPGSFYASQSALMLAKDAFDAGQLDESRKQLEWVLAHGADVHKGIARARLASVLLDQKKYDEALKTLDGNKDEAYTPMLADLKGDIMLAQNRMDEARAAYKAAIDKSDAHNPVKQIAQTKLNALGGSQ